MKNYVYYAKLINQLSFKMIFPKSDYENAMRML